MDSFFAVQLDVREAVEFGAFTFTDADAQTCNADSVLYIIGTNSENLPEDVLFMDDDGGVNQCSRLVVELEPDIYFLVVEGFERAAGTWELIFGSLD